MRMSSGRSPATILTPNINNNPIGVRRQRPYPPTDPRRQRRYLGPPISTPSSSSVASLKGCWLFLLLTFIALLAVVIALVVLLALKPKKPQFDLQKVPLSLNISLLFLADNPNNVGIRYESAAFYVMYRGLPLGVATVPGFELPAHSRRLIQIRVDRFNVLQADALNLVRDAAIDYRVDLRLTGDVAANILLLGISTPRVQSSVSGWQFPIQGMCIERTHSSS